jgi:hypothetical protein
MTDRDETPYDAQGRVAIEGAPGWRYLPFEATAEPAAITVRAEAQDGGAVVAFTVPTYVSRGDELGEITRAVIRAHERMERSAGLGA